MGKPKGLPLAAFGIFLLAACIGAAVGLLGVGFLAVLREVQHLVMGSGGTVVEAARELAPWQRLVVPAAGGLAAALCLLWLRGIPAPFGISDILALVVTRKGTIRVRPSLLQIASSACSISTGSSVGREGANSQFGATVGAALGRLFGCDSRTKAVLLGCGVAAGMAISYNAPIAGALFVMEVILGNFAMDVFAPIVVASVVATLVSNAMIESRGALYESSIDMHHWTLVLSVVLLGGACGVGAMLFRRALDLGRQAFALLRLPLIVAMPLGGALVGLIGIWYPEVWGNGYDVLRDTTSNRLSLTVLLSLAVWKLIATALSTGSGSLGGVFTPNLVVGAAFGAAFGRLVEASPLALPAVFDRGDLVVGFALVGMAGLCSATTHAPITAIILAFELTRDYGLILPLMLCSIIASITARLFDKESLYTSRLRDMQHLLAGGIEALTMQRHDVREAMRSDIVKVRRTAMFDDVMDVFSNARRDTVYVVDDGETLLGRIHIHDVKYFINDSSLKSVVIAADLSQPAVPVVPDQSLASVLPRFDDPDLEELPVVSPGPTPRLLGRLTRRDVIALLSHEVLGQRRLRTKLGVEGESAASYIELPEGSELARVHVPDALIGRALDSLDLPGTAGLTPIVVIQPDDDGREQRLLPQPSHVLIDGSALVVLGRPEAIAAFQSVVT